MLIRNTLIEMWFLGGNTAITPRPYVQYHHRSPSSYHTHTYITMTTYTSRWPPKFQYAGLQLSAHNGNELPGLLPSFMQMSRLRALTFFWLYLSTHHLHHLIIIHCNKFLCSLSCLLPSPAVVTLLLLLILSSPPGHPSLIYHYHSCLWKLLPVPC